MEAVHLATCLWCELVYTCFLCVLIFLLYPSDRVACVRESSVCQSQWKCLSGVLAHLSRSLNLLCLYNLYISCPDYLDLACVCHLARLCVGLLQECSRCPHWALSESCHNWSTSGVPSTGLLEHQVSWVLCNNTWLWYVPSLPEFPRRLSSRKSRLVQNQWVYLLLIIL